MSHDGEWFRAKLHDIRKTQADLTRFVGLDAATIVRVFKDERKVKIDELKLFSQFFQCTTLELLSHLGVDFVEGKKSTLSENDVDKDILFRFAWMNISIRQILRILIHLKYRRLFQLYI